MGRALIVAPHHDDEVIGCGGTIGKLASAGHTLGVIYLTAGYSGLPNTEDREEAVRIRESEARCAGEALGVSDQFFLRRPDRELVYSFDLVAELVRIFRDWRTEGVYAPHPLEQDREHRVACSLTQEAVMLSSKDCFPELGKPIPPLRRFFLYEVWTPLQVVQHVEDISEFASRKVDALRCYASQFGAIEAEKLLGMNYYRPSLRGRAGCDEVFQAGGAVEIPWENLDGI